ncbi:hypothetical protein E2320_022906, partial [Naja naja]
FTNFPVLKTNEDENTSARMVRLLALILWLSLEECKRVSRKCPRTQFFTVPHDWYQPGMLLIGGMASQIIYVFNEVSFKNIPSQDIGFDLPLTYGSFAPEDFVKTKDLTFYRMVPNDENQYMGIIHLLLHFGWTWVGLFTGDDDSGKYFLQSMEVLFSKYQICSAFIQVFPRQGRVLSSDDMGTFGNLHVSGMDQRATAFIIYGDTMNL